MSAGSNNLARWQAVQREENIRLVGPALELAAELRAKGRTWSECVAELNAQSMTSRTGAPWILPALVQAFARWKRQR